VSTASQQIRSLPEADRTSFLKQGYTVVRSILSNDEIEHLRAVATETIDTLEELDLTTTETGSEGVIRASSCDLLSIPSMRHVLLDQRLLHAVGVLLGDRPCYFGDSSLRIGKTGARAWHRDNVDRVRWRGGPDWQDPYPLLRCGLYLQDQARHSGGLALRPCSNRPDRRLPTLPRLVKAGAGDLVAWDLRIVHSGEVVRPRGLPSTALNPRLQTYLPQVMRIPDDRERIVMFMTFGLAGPHLDHYISYLETRDYMRISWRKSSFGEEIWEEAESAGLSVLHPTPEYGTPADPARS
jgi:hypothetical protein